MEEDIQNYSPTVMFRGTPCSKDPGKAFTGTIANWACHFFKWRFQTCFINKNSSIFRKI